MPDKVSDIWANIKTYWSELEKEQKNRVYIIAGILVAVITVMLIISTRVEYISLIAEGEDYDIKAIVDYLEEHGYKYKAGEGGKIYIDKRKKAEIELGLSKDLIISPAVKFTDTWSQLSLTATESDKEQLWKNYMEKSLRSKLKKFKNVVDAEVQFSKPERTIWARTEQEENKGSAYVMLKKKGGLSVRQVQGVVRVVASSLGIPENAITVVDENLNILNRNMADPSMDMVSTQEELRLKKQHELEESIYKHFKVGIVQYDDFDTLSVTVNPVLDFDKVVSKQTKYSASGQDGESLLKSKEELKENLENGQASAAPGLDSNPGSVSYQVGNNGSSSYNKAHKVEEYANNISETEVQKALGKFVKEASSMTLSLYYGRRVKDANGLTDKFLQQVKADASSATGIPVENISVSIYKLAPEPIEKVPFTETMKQVLDAYGFFVIMLILLVALAIAAVPKRKEEEEELEPAYAGVGPQFIVPEGEEPLPEIDTEERNELRRQIDKFVEQKPDVVAQLLRNWLMDEWE